MKKVVYISGTRADYGLMKPVLTGINENPNLDLEIIATGMHLMPEFGNSINIIQKDGFKVSKINATHEQDNKESMSEFLGKFVQNLTKEIAEINPDFP